jgi:hypothetical protein
MIFEYALEPLLLSSWSNFQRLVSLFGIPNGRLISRYPKRWARLVYDSVPSGTTEKAKIEVALRRVERELLLPRNHQWDGSADWLSNAVSEHGRAPFQAILASSNGGDACSLVVDATDLDCTDLPPLLKAGPRRIVTRDAAELGKALRPLLLISKRILIVEPTFTIKSPRFREPLAALVAAALDLQRRVRADCDVELHLGMDKLDEYADKAAALNTFLSPQVPERMTLSVVGWHKDDLHNRFVVTDCFAIMLGEGLGLPDSRSSRTDDVLALVESATAAELLGRYGNKAKHQFTHRVVGSKQLAP